jgi:translation initiation factor IF-2
MTEKEKTIRLSKVKGELNVSLDRIFEYLDDQGHKLERNPNQKISEDQYRLLLQEFAQDREEKEEAKQVTNTSRTRKETIVLDETVKPAKRERESDQDEILIKDMNSPSAKTPEVKKEKEKEKEKPVEEEVVRAKPEKAVGLKVISKIELEPAKEKKKKKPEPEVKPEPEAEKPKKVSKKKKEEPEVVAETPVAPPEPIAEVEVEKPVEVKEPPAEEVLFRRNVEKLEGPKIMGKIELPVKEERKKPVASSSAEFEAEKKKNAAAFAKRADP